MDLIGTIFVTNQVKLDKTRQTYIKEIKARAELDTPNKQKYVLNIKKIQN